MCGEDGLAFKLTLEIESPDEAALSLLSRAVEGDLQEVTLPETAHPGSDLVLGTDFPAGGNEGRGIEVDQVFSARACAH